MVQDGVATGGQAEGGGEVEQVVGVADKRADGVLSGQPSVQAPLGCEVDAPLEPENAVVPMPAGGAARRDS